MQVIVTGVEDVFDRGKNKGVVLWFSIGRGVGKYFYACVCYSVYLRMYDGAHTLTLHVEYLDVSPAAEQYTWRCQKKFRCDIALAYMYTIS